MDLSSAGCDTVGVLGIYFPVTSFLLTDCIAYATYRLSFGNSVPKLLGMLLFSFLFPLLPIAAILALHLEGNDTRYTGGWCWIRGSSHKGELLGQMLLAGKAIEWISCFFFVPITSWMVTKRIRRINRETEAYYADALGGDKNSPAVRNMELSDSPQIGMDAPTHRRLPSTDVVKATAILKTLHSRLIALPVLFVLARLPGNATCIVSLVASDKYVPDWLHGAQAVGDPLQGFINFCLFVLLSVQARKWFLCMRD